MKSRIAFLVIFLFVFPALFAQNPAKYLKISPPPEGCKVKFPLLFDLKILEAAIAAEDLPQPFTVTVTEPTGITLCTIGTRDKNKSKWDGKVLNGTDLAATMSESYYPELLKKVRDQVPKPGIQLRFSAPKTGETLKTYDLLLVSLPDLEIRMDYPPQVKPGEALTGKVKLEVVNKGVEAVQNVEVELILSIDRKLPAAGGIEADRYVEDALLKSGRLIVDALAPGARKTLDIPASLALLADTPPQKYILIAAVDPRNRFRDLNREDNTLFGLLMVTVAPPKKLTVELPDVVLRYEPAVNVFKLESRGIILSDGKDWKFCKMSPSSYQIRHINWKDVYWEIDTQYREIFEIRGNPFCKKGGKGKQLRFPLEVKGGGAKTEPAFFSLKIPNCQLVFEPETRKFNVMVNGIASEWIPFWKVCRLDYHLYHFRNAPWSDYFLEFDSFRREIRQVTGGEFCKPVTAGAEKVDLVLQVEE